MAVARLGCPAEMVYVWPVVYGSDAVRRSLPQTGEYTQMDFVNQSSLSCQMQLLEELNKKKITSQADMFQFSWCLF